VPDEASTPAALPRSASSAAGIPLFGFVFDDLTQPGLLERIGAAIGARRRCWVATLNVNLLCLAHRDPAYCGVLERADLRIADGMPIVWMSRLRGTPLAGRVTGSDLLVPLAERAAASGWRVFLCGAAAGVADRAAEELARRAPGLRVVGTASPSLADPPGPGEARANAELLAAIRAAAPDVLLVALGSPKQERWIDAQYRSGALEVPVTIGVGASFDFVAGRQVRAPRWMRRSGLEWVHRALTQPGRLGPRYLRDAGTFARLCWRELRAPRSGSGARDR
jgi:N-acetylglucosaminyldiphosphoundecaprenol N-acetyl-beta-D-mannosaminyltransferase